MLLFYVASSVTVWAKNCVKLHGHAGGVAEGGDCIIVTSMFPPTLFCRDTIAASRVSTPKTTVIG